MRRLLQDIRHSAHVSLQRKQYAQVGSNALSAPPHSLLARTLPWFLQLAFFFTTFGFLAFRYQTVATEQACTSRLSSYSPIIDAGVIRYTSYNIAGDFEQPSVYRGRPTNTTEAAWKKLFIAPGINVPETKLPLLNKSSTVNWLRTPEDKGDGYVGYLEVFHQLHCLHMVRLKIYQKEYEEEFGYPAAQFEPEHANITATHIDHCLETLRLNMMCTADVTPVMIVADETAPLGRYVDFNTMHKCRNFWDIRAWVDQNKVMD
ncbi:hypothetical protein BDV37DRAFT_282913 [Aspergillus pseudonomiae]|uniref:Tat pathway signal sequence n=1 Tax=Aspergillus pseudonomiae TaxID=1506151 RepID=A0A5N7DDP0_9EURO|nr:uncharacterized protein BDV37DRAFT_282913 [Aspergillus pseudonomiae]KAE8404364.1 hypothetical protein BDV37DRAFT_282913 [Aspergillus pseudonomiae]